MPRKQGTLRFVDPGYGSLHWLKCTCGSEEVKIYRSYDQASIVAECSKCEGHVRLISNGKIFVG